MVLAWKALRELGLAQLAHYAHYQVLLRTGSLRRATPNGRSGARELSSLTYLRPLLVLPDQEQLEHVLGEDGLAKALIEANEIIAGKVRLFGGEAVPLQLNCPKPLHHWTAYESGKAAAVGEERQDLKLVWEPGRFGWAYTLGRAYLLSWDERYARAFWEYTQAFLDENPPYLGPHWMSAQEVALRLIALVYCAQIFSESVHSTGERLNRLAQAVANHARRIPPTLSYARAQNNNHLLSEAAGLYTAGLALPSHPQAKRWREMGWRWLQRGFQSQIDRDGAYLQHSTNYHRLMLQLALWVRAISDPAKRDFPPPIHERLAAATRWLLALVDPHNGFVPNLGPNDGAYILPLTVSPFADFRPVLQAAASAFLGGGCFPPGPWNEMSLWFGAINTAPMQASPVVGTRSSTPVSSRAEPYPAGPIVLRNTRNDSHAYLRAARFRARPGHADQLHLDLWWRGFNLAQDAGTYLYNALPPWDNRLSHTRVHNTVTVNGEDQMTRAGRFLWLDWAQAEVIARERAEDGSWERLVARHDGYRRLEWVHQRSVSAFRDGRWLVEDDLLRVGKLERSNVKTFQRFDLHWLLPDWEWKVKESGEPSIEIRLSSPHGWITLKIGIEAKSQPSNLDSRITNVGVVRAGRLLYGSGEAEPIMGWVSPTYAHKHPALSLTVSADASQPFSFITEWILP